MMRLVRRLVDGGAAAAGVVLRALFAVILLFRRPRPIHARGLVLEGELTRTGTGDRTGVPLIDDAAGDTVEVTARLSRSIGLPAWAPDVIGLALRVRTARGDADLEFASTGWGVPGRFLLSPRLTSAAGTFTTVFPYRTAKGPLLLGIRSGAREVPADLPGLAEALRRDAWRLELHAATPTGRWLRWGQLALRTAEVQDDEDLRFDPVQRSLPGTGSYRWARLARRPSYRLTQSGRW